MKPYHWISKPVESVRGEIKVPGDKSISHRALLLGSIAQGQTYISGFLESEDCLATLRAVQSLGVHLERPGKGKVLIHGVGKYGLQAPAGVVDCGNAGTSMRLLAGLLAAAPFDTQLTGDSSLLARPMQRIVHPLTQMGAKVTTRRGCAPLCIQGNQALQGIRYTLAQASAQVKSCILLAGMYAKGETCVREPLPTRDHTERLLAQFSYPIEHRDGQIIIHSEAEAQGTEIYVPGDISSAAFFIVTACLIPHSKLLIRGVNINPTRTGVLSILGQMGAHITLNNAKTYGVEPVADIEVHYAPLKGVTIPPELVPCTIDEFPILLIAAACAQGKTVLQGAQELRFKESDRIKAMVNGLKVLGVDVHELKDGIGIEGGKIQGGIVDSVHDHRIAMAFAMAGAVACAPITILNCANVVTSFPSFREAANTVGCAIEVLSQKKEEEFFYMQHAKVPVITLDGPSGTGKGTIAQRLAKYLGWHFLDSGAIYRVLALAAEKRKLSLNNIQDLVQLAHAMDLRFVLNEENDSQVVLDTECVDQEIRTPACGQNASKIAAIPEIRQALLERQRAFAQLPGLVTDGRDMGTVVFPMAGLKIYLHASPQERGRRRYLQLKEKQNNVSLAQVVEELSQRDSRDAARAHSPMKPAADAVNIDTTNLTINQVFDKIVQLVSERFT